MNAIPKQKIVVKIYQLFIQSKQTSWTMYDKSFTFFFYYKNVALAIVQKN